MLEVHRRRPLPHKMISQLPDAVKNNLPRHEQEIYT